MEESIRSQAEFVKLLGDRIKVLATRHAEAVKAISDRVRVLAKVHTDTVQRFGRLTELAQRVRAGQPAKR